MAGDRVRRHRTAAHIQIIFKFDINLTLISCKRLLNSVKNIHGRLVGLNSVL